MGQKKQSLVLEKQFLQLHLFGSAHKQMQKSYATKYIYFPSLLFFVISFHFCLVQMQRIGPVDTSTQVMFIGEQSALQ